MNSIENLIVLEAKLSEQGCYPLTSALDRIWCKGDKNAYQEITQMLAYTIRSYWITQGYVKRDFNNIYYPAGRGIMRRDYQTIKVFDKYFSKNKKNYVDIFYASKKAMMIKNQERFLEIKLPENITGISLVTRVFDHENGMLRDKILAVAVQMNITQTAGSLSTIFDLRDVTLIEGLEVIYDAINRMQLVAIKVDGKPASQIFNITHDVAMDVGTMIGDRLSRVTFTLTHN